MSYQRICFFILIRRVRWKYVGRGRRNLSWKILETDAGGAPAEPGQIRSHVAASCSICNLRPVRYVRFDYYQVVGDDLKTLSLALVAHMRIRPIWDRFAIGASAWLARWQLQYILKHSTFLCLRYARFHLAGWRISSYGFCARSMFKLV